MVLVVHPLSEDYVFGVIHGPELVLDAKTG